MAKKTKCSPVAIFAIEPPVVQCTCGKRVVMHREGLYREHLDGINPGDNFPWPQED